MTTFSGRRVSVGLAKEITRGTGVAPAHWLPHTSLSYDDKVEKVDSTEAIGRIEDSDDTFVTSKWAEGSLEGNIRTEGFGLILLGTMGTVVSASVGGSAYSHTYTLSQTNNHQSLTFTAVDPIGTSQFVKSVISSLAINVETNALVTHTTEFMGMTSKGASATASFASEPTFTSRHVCLKLAADTTGLDAATNITIKGFTVTFTKNVLKNDVTCSVEPDDFFNQDFVVEGEFTLDYNDRVYRELMRENSYRALRLTAEDTGVSIGDDDNPKLVIELSRVDLRDWEADRPIDSVSTQKVAFKAFVDIANSKDMVNEISLVNTTASY